MNYGGLNEAALKAEIQKDFFSDYNYTVELERVDFVIAAHNVESKNAILFSEEALLKSILWAEAKQGTTHDIYESFVQLILTIGKERTFEKYLPPKFIGAFDAEKIAFIEYHDVQSVFYQNDFNWNVTPSNHNSKEFKQLLEMSKSALEASSMLFYYETQEKELRDFIALNFKTSSDVTEKIAVTKNNFTYVFTQWSETVKPTIAVNWERVNKVGIISADFFLADLLSRDNESLKDNLFVVLQKTKYELARKIDEETGLFDSKKVGFLDNQKAHRAFWAIYERPPKEEYWSYIIGRRDLLVPQDIRERKGSFFTPKKWVKLSQKYLADILGENWQDEYYIWDCCAGTGNLLNYLTNYDNVWASTLDKADVDVMIDRIHTGWNMAENHVFQFDFLNDEFAPENPEDFDENKNQANKGLKPLAKGKLPNELYEIISDDEKRKKLVVYINPPYAEAASVRTIAGKGGNKTGVATKNKTYQKYKNVIGKASNEIFAQFFIRIADELRGCILGEFSKLKILQAANFADFRTAFASKLEKLFIVPANTFDNVSGDFPIGFFIWNTTFSSNCVKFIADAYNADAVFIAQKAYFIEAKNTKYINQWYSSFYDNAGEYLGIMNTRGNDFQNYNYIRITSDDNYNHTNKITPNNLIQTCIYFSVRLCIEQSWLNDRDQFLYPSGEWESDREFQLDCIVFTLFYGQNRISAEVGVNHWIPFRREEVGCKRTFKSNFMAKFLRDFMAGKIALKTRPLLLEGEGKTRVHPSSLRSGTGGEVFSEQAASVFDAGKALWRFYFAQGGENENASFYDIRKYFQGVDGKGRMNNKSNNAEYNVLIDDLRTKQKTLAAKIAEKVYEYGFLR